MSDTPLRQLGTLGGSAYFSRIVPGAHGTFGRAIVDSNGDTTATSTTFSSDLDLCEGDLANAFQKLQKLSNAHIMGELEY